MIFHFPFWKGRIDIKERHVMFLVLDLLPGAIHILKKKISTL